LKSLIAPSRCFVAGTASLLLIFGAVAAVYSRRYTVSASAAIGIYLAFAALLVLSVVPASQRGTAGQIPAAAKPFLTFVAIWCAPYLLYAACTRDFQWTALLKLLLLAIVPPAIYTLYPPRKPAAFSWPDAWVAAFLVGSVLSGRMRGIWNVPMNLDFMTRLFLITVAS
jgi:hypothetical protein